MQNPNFLRPSIIAQTTDTDKTPNINPSGRQPCVLVRARQRVAVRRPDQFPGHEDEEGPHPALRTERTPGAACDPEP